MKKNILSLCALALLVALMVCFFEFLNNSKTLSNICVENKCGYINKYNKVVIPLAFDDAKPVEFDAAVVKYKGYYGALSKSKKNIVPFRYAYLKPLNKDTFLACIFLDKNGAPKNCGLVDKKENTIVPFKYYDIKIEKNKIMVKESANSEFKEYKD